MENNELSEKDLILSLLSDYLRSYRLIVGLNNMGLDANNYNIHLGDTIFNLMGLGDEKDETIYERFFEYSQLVIDIDIKNYPEKFDAYVNQIYEWLCTEKIASEKKKIAMEKIALKDGKRFGKVVYETALYIIELKNGTTYSYADLNGWDAGEVKDMDGFDETIELVEK